MNGKCPLCQRFASIYSSQLIDGEEYNCDNCKHYLLTRELIEEMDKDIRIKNIIYSFLLHQPKKNTIYVFYYDDNNIEKSEQPDFINVWLLLKDYPKNIAEKINKILYNLSVKYPNIGDEISLFDIDYRIIYCEKDIEEEQMALLDMLVNINYLYRPNAHYRISFMGWKRLEELNREYNAVNQAFIAMSIDDITNDIYETFVKAISSCGYKSVRIDEKEHNNQIVPEIFFEIKRSKFIVVDVTYSNLGAYYEAGYAEALGKQVIVCCKKEQFVKSPPHFDISQKNMILWDDFNDLKKRLGKRIESTIGKNEAAR